VRRDGGAATRTGGAWQWGDGGAAVVVREATRQGGDGVREDGHTAPDAAAGGAAGGSVGRGRGLAVARFLV